MFTLDKFEWSFRILELNGVKLTTFRIQKLVNQAEPNALITTKRRYVFVKKIVRNAQNIMAAELVACPMPCFPRNVWLDFFPMP